MSKRDLYYKRAGLCDCGNPGAKYAFMCSVVKFAKDWQDEDTPDWRVKGKVPCVSDALDAALLESPELRQGAVGFILDMLNNLDLLEHGGGARCSWPSGLGRELLEHEDSDDEL